MLFLTTEIIKLYSIKHAMSSFRLNLLLLKLKNKNWKYYNKIIFKCVNSIVGPVNSTWIVFFVSWIVKSCDITVHTQKKKSKNVKRIRHFQWNPNGYYMLKNLTSCYSKLSFLRAHCNKMLSFFNVFNSLSPDSHSRSLLSLFLRLSLL